MKTLRPRLATLSAGVQTMPAGSWRASGASGNARGYTYAWQRARERFLKANPLCVMCQAKDVVEASTTVDHIIPHRGDQVLFWDRNNWQALCKPHHDSDAQKKDNLLQAGAG